MRVAFCDGVTPYVVPITFGFKDDKIYFHSSPKGMKIDILKKNNKVCFEIDVDAEIIPGDTPCKYEVKYRSIIGFGYAHILYDEQEKTNGLNILMGHYAQGPFSYDTKNVKRACIIRIDIETITGKQYGFETNETD
ncbi:MAG TPA: pyridoxamine 5'-phosphate oxidase family protein [Desulfobacteraceae bacterium]|nr:pyridoxamine 5'-phosphate oxidase family protein [Desulfobacteraceae bacterium]